MPVLRSVTQYEPSGVHSLLGILSKRFWSGSSQPTGPIRFSLNTFPVLESPWEMNSLTLPCYFPRSIFIFCRGFCSKVCNLESRRAMFAGQRNRNSL
jgi:hypothetical protein